MSSARDATKRFWRPLGQHGRSWHCLVRSRVGQYVSLCGDHTTERSGGQHLRRPPIERRCPLCDSREILAKDEYGSLDPSPDFADAPDMSLLGYRAASKKLAAITTSAPHTS